jgi:hypothetical protein
MMQVNLLKIAVAVLLIILAGGAWLALDYMNRQEQLQAKAIQSGLQQARLEAKNRNRMQSSMEAILNTYQTNCEAAADKARTDYLALMQKQMPAKHKTQLPLPQATQDEAAALASNAKAECGKQREELQKKGF